MLIKKREGDLKATHNDMLDSKVPDNAPIELWGTFIYRGPDGGEWRIVDIENLFLFKTSPVPTPTPSLNQCRKEKGFLVCKKPCVQGFWRDGLFWELAPGAADPARPNECWYASILAAEPSK
ncbi:MAG: hypothetical protein ACREWG_11575 [Gammaproteobacteria bacterium]